MVKLTETMIFQRTRKNDLKYVIELNCWGSDLTDVSILRQMPHLQVLSLSVNRISSLADFECCSSLRDLYLRKNCIDSLSELSHLQDLPCLRVLWLEENPCARLPNYRQRVLRYLPQLDKLDNIPVTNEEVQLACYSDQGQPAVDYSPSPIPAAVRYCPSANSPSPSCSQANNRYNNNSYQLPTTTTPPPCDDCNYEQLSPSKSNVLRAILCLIKELDRDSLEIIEDAVHNRLDAQSCS